MPQLKDLENKLKSFEKTSYTPWDDLPGPNDSVTPVKTVDIEQALERGPLHQNVKLENSALEQNSGNEKSNFSTQNKRVTNGKQTVNKRVSQPRTNGKQKDNKRITNGKQKANRNENKRVTNGKQTVNKRVSQPRTNGKQKTSLEKFTQICGIQRQIVYFLFKLCRSRSMNSTGEISLDYLYSVTNFSKASIKTSINRLKNKGLLKTIDRKDGRGGWVNYAFSDELYTNLINNADLISTNDDSIQEKDQINDKRITNGKQTVNKRVSQPMSQPITTFSSSSSNNINTTTTEDLDIIKKEEEWSNVNYSFLADIGFNTHHIQQLYQARCTTSEQLQNSIKHFAFDLEHNGKRNDIKGTPLSFFMGIMRRHGLYNAPENYQDPRDKAIAQYLEDQEQQRKKRVALEKRWFELEKQKWLDTLSEETKNALLPDHVRAGRLNGPKQACLSEHFKQTIWPEVSQNKPWLSEEA